MSQDAAGSAGSEVQTSIDLSIYSLNAILKTAYKFTGRCFIRLQSTDGHIVLTLRPKRQDVDRSIELGEFLNELLDQRLREIIGTETSQLRDLIMSHALSKTTLLQAELESCEPFQDPLAIAIPDQFKAPLN